MCQGSFGVGGGMFGVWIVLVQSAYQNSRLCAEKGDFYCL